jgi:hypothetical protein
MQLFRNTFAAGEVATALVLFNCSSQGVPSTGGSMSGNSPPGHVGIIAGTAGNTGIVGAYLSIGAGVSLTSLDWRISNGGTPYTGTVNIGDAQSVEWVAGGIQAGSGYTLTGTGTDNHGDPCNGGTALFTVVAGATVQVSLSVTCVIPTDAAVAADIETGSVEVDASVTLVGTPPVACPGITSLSINPAEQMAGAPVQLNLMTTGPAPLITWSVSPPGDGSFSNANAPNPTFTCTNATQNPLTITATVGLPDSGLCAGQSVTTLSAFFNCESGALSCAQINPALPNACPDADGGTTCVDVNTDPNNCGGCGHVCPPALGATCCHGSCEGQPPTACVAAPCGVCGPNSVLCSGSPNGVCTPTEALIVAHDVLKNGQGPDINTDGGCYTCLVANACLDSSGSGPPPAGNGSGTAVTNAECGDPNGPGLNPPFDNPNVSLTNVGQCLDALACTLTTDGTNPASECSLSQPPASVSRLLLRREHGLRVPFVGRRSDRRVRIEHRRRRGLDRPDDRPGALHGPDLQPRRRRPRDPELRPHRARDAPRRREVPHLLQLSGFASSSLGAIASIALSACDVLTARAQRPCRRRAFAARHRRRVDETPLPNGGYYPGRLRPTERRLRSQQHRWERRGSRRRQRE